ncbi:MAG: hypothetical protein H6592_05690 [Flavobacteriales bacterium]|nr:hypothetical protein [Flavobacteriales bacterium]
MMRHLPSILFALLVQSGSAQFYNWGWGPPISVTQNGSTISCTVWDPLLDQSRTQSYSSVAEWSSVDGVVATLSSSGVVRGIVYDIDLSQFRDDNFSFVSGTSVTNADGIIAWVTGSGTVGAAIYNPATQQWLDDTFSFSSGTSIINRHGVVSWVTGSGTVGAAVFDPGTQQWMDDSFSFSSGTTMYNRDGVVAWVTGSGTVGAAIYDPSNGQWMDDSFSFSSGTTVVLEDGVVAWRTGSGTIGAAAYNWNNDQWVDGSFSFNSENTALSIIDGTVHWTNNSGAQRQGFTGSNQWQSNANTAVRCIYYPEQVGASGAPHIAYLWCLSIGASSYSHACGDGHTITRRWAWKRYANPGTYQPQLTVFSSTANSACDGTLNFSGTGLNEATSAELRISWTGNSIRLVAEEPIGVVRVMDARGSVVVAGRSRDTFMELPADLAPGVYLVHTTDHGTQRLIVAD